MSKEVKNKIAPELRFPEFANSTAWLFKNGDILFDQISDKNHNSDLPILAITQEHGAIPRDQIDYNVAVTDKSIESYKVVQVGDFIISLRSFQGGIEYSNYQGLCSPAYIILRKKNDSDVVNSFFKHYFKTKSFIRDLNKNLEGIRDGKMISYKQFSEILIPVPKPEEQQKIASCLSSLDDLITAHTQKLEALKAHKKGLMQQLFPAEGDKVPKLRFAEFKNSGEWIFEKLGQLYSFFTTNSLSRDDLNYQKGSVKNIHYGDIHTKFETLFDINKEKVPFINPEINISKIKSESYCIEGDLIFADASEDLNDIGKSIEVVNLNSEKLLAGMHTLLARQKETKLIVGFGGVLLKSSNIRNQIQKESQGTKVLGISSSRLVNVTIYYPKNKKEQKKIVDCLSSLDMFIKTTLEKIEQLKMHKKGLMQGLFPTLNSNENG